MKQNGSYLKGEWSPLTRLRRPDESAAVSFCQSELIYNLIVQVDPHRISQKIVGLRYRNGQEFGRVKVVYN